MGRRGPAPTPTNVLAARGSWRAKARQEAEPPRLEGEPERPSWLKGEAKRIWGNLVEWLRGMGVLSATDVTAMTRYCQYWEQWSDATRMLREEGYTQDVVEWQRKFGEQLDRLEKQFGLTPASRASIANSSIGRKTEKPKSDAESFLENLG